MSGFVGRVASVLGVLGALVCPAAIGLGWWAAVRTADRATIIADRLDYGLSEADARLERIEARLAAVRGELKGMQGEAEKLPAENSDFLRGKAAIDKLVDRLLPTVERAAELAESLRTVAAGLRAVVDVVSELGVEIAQPSRALATADAIDRAAEMLNVPQSRVDTLKAAAALRVRRELLELSLLAAAGSERLAEGLADARREVTVARECVGLYRDQFRLWLRVTTVGHTLGWVWIGFGQLCLIGWGRRRFASRGSLTTAPTTVRPA
jgi:hypothetical protein